MQVSFIAVTKSRCLIRRIRGLRLALTEWRERGARSFDGKPLAQRHRLRRISALHDFDRVRMRNKAA